MSVIFRNVTRRPVAIGPSITILFVIIFTAPSSSAQLSFEREPIEYSKTPGSDPVALLRTKLENGEVSLHKDKQRGYLVSLLTELQIPVSSQTLVFSKTSLQRHLISPSNPRAIYFNDDTYVAWIPNGELIEIASTDSKLGSMFYTVDQTGEKQTATIVRRTERCLFCHASSDTGRVPGLLMQSVYTNSDGDRVFPADSIPTDSKGSLRGRWAGWFVTGSHGNQRHLGNLMIDSKTAKTAGDTVDHANVMDLSRWFDVTKYLSRHSDLVALLVLQHQVSIHNLLTDANHRARAQLHFAAMANREQGREDRFLSDEDLAYFDQIAEQVVDGLLMLGQVRLEERVSGTSGFAEEFSNRGPHDSRGRSLRQLDLRSGLFQHPCSYLIYSESFDAIPQPVLSFVYQRLFDVLSSQDTRDKYAKLSVANRSAILQILRETKTNLPANWKTALP